MVPTSVLIVDDHPIMREALAAAIYAEADLEVAAAVANSEQALRSYLELNPDVVLMDLMLPGMDGIQATAAIAAVDPSARILVLTSNTDDAKVPDALAAGASGYLLKDAEREQILSGLRAVAAGETYLPAREASKLVQALQDGRLVNAKLLTAREVEVLALAANGLNDLQIAESMAVTEATVRVHFHHVIRKLKVPDRRTAVEWFRQQ